MSQPINDREIFMFTIEVGVALSRPPKTDRISQVQVLAFTESEAHLTALQMAHRPDVVMPVFSSTVAVEV